MLLTALALERCSCS